MDLDRMIKRIILSIMKHAILAALCTILPLIVISIRLTDNKCTRHRKPWHMISDEERLLFVNGFQSLRRNGILSTFATTHHLEGIAFANIHKTSEFFYWHSYFVWEIETAFRALGDDYQCFAMPYWDISIDADYVKDHSPMDDDLPLFEHDFLGHYGTDHDLCVKGELWGINRYTTQYLCAADEISNQCCLKRQRDRTVRTIGSKEELTDAIINDRQFRAFQHAVAGIHGSVHRLFAMNNESHMYSNNAAEDPVFLLLHSFVDYIRFMRTDCWQYDQLNIHEIDEYIPYAFDGFFMEFSNTDQLKKVRLDSVMDFAMVCDMESTYCHEHEVTPRVMFDAQSLDVSYELGSFWNENDDLQRFCAQKINNSWFYDTYSDHGKDSGRQSNGYMYIILLCCASVGGLLFTALAVMYTQNVSFTRSEKETIYERRSYVYGSV
eukprot:419667_1